MTYETVADIIAERDRLKKALSFYADPIRHRGPNQILRDDEKDEWAEAAGLKAYRLDVYRDGGNIARQALAATPTQEITASPEIKTALANGSENPQGYSITGRISQDGEIYKEVTLDIANAEGESVAFVVASLDAQTLEPIIHITAGGNPDDLTFEVRPLRDAGEAVRNIHDVRMQPVRKTSPGL